MRVSSTAMMMAMVAIAAACNDDSQCTTGQFCRCNMNDVDSPGTCTERASHGERCGGFTFCPTSCKQGLLCKAERQADFEPQMSDMPGLCCPKLDCACPTTRRHQLDSQGCEICACEAKPCYGAQPATADDDAWSVVTCGRGSAPCPADTHCHVHPADKWAVCCPESAFLAQEEQEEELLDTAEAATTEAATTAAPLVVAGGVRVADEISPEIVSAAQCAVLELNARSNGLYQQQLVKVVTASTQVVAGIKYTLQVATGESSSCRNDGEQRSLAVCPVDGVVMTYVLSVLVQAWTQQPCQLLDFSLVLDADAMQEDEEASGSGSGEEPEQSEQYDCIKHDPAAFKLYCSYRSVNNHTYSESNTSTVVHGWPSDAFQNAEKNAYCCDQHLHWKKGCGTKRRGMWGMSYGKAMTLVAVCGSALVLLAFAVLVVRRRRRSKRRRYTMVSGVQVVPVGGDTLVKAQGKLSKSHPQQQFFENPAYRVQGFDEKNTAPATDC